MTDISIAQQAHIQPIVDICKTVGIDDQQIELYGKYKAKININCIAPKAKIILVTAINPTKMGEGKTTMSIGIADGMKRMGKSVILALREPSLGPVFGMKGGATGGGHAQIIPMEDINLHFTGDIHAITTANNLLSATIDNHIFQQNTLGINPAKIVWCRCMDMNDRALRNIVCGLGTDKDGIPHTDKFHITAASEIMAILCLANSLHDLKEKLGNITIAYNYDNDPVYCKDLGVHEAMAILLKEAIKPNIVQTLEGTPAIIHGGPFANIAHGCNSILATKTAATYADYVITEAGFGADLGAEKFIDLKCRMANITPSVVVIVATIKALKLAGGADTENLNLPNMTALEKGLANLGKHIESMTQIFQLPCIVGINKYQLDKQKEIEIVKSFCHKYKVDAYEISAYAEGGKGATNIAKKVVQLCDSFSGTTKFAYELNDSIEEKINHIVQKIYGGNAVKYSEKAKKQILKIQQSEFANLPIVIAKTQYSLSDNPQLVGRPTNFNITIKEILLKSGAGFIVAVAGNMTLMPGLPKIPTAQNMQISNEGIISGLF